MKITKASSWSQVSNADEFRLYNLETAIDRYFNSLGVQMEINFTAIFKKFYPIKISFMELKNIILSEYEAKKC